MSQTAKERVQLLIKPKAKLQLVAYARYRGWTLTKLIEGFGPLCERKLREALSPEQFESYRSGNFEVVELHTAP